MTRQLFLNGRQTASVVGRDDRGRPAAVTTEHSLLTTSWTADVLTMETAIAGFTEHRPLSSDCQVALFEIEGDHQLHVNVVHQHAPTAVAGWSGPGKVPAGCVYNRRFADSAPKIIKSIRDMVFA
jgi:hypothetical protein